MKINVPGYLLILMALTLTSAACSDSGATIPQTDAAITAPAAVTGPTGEPAAGAAAESQFATAEALVAELYKQHDAQHNSPFFQTKNRALVDKYFTKPLADLIWMDATQTSGEVGAIDRDPLYDAQDVEIKNFAIGTVEMKGETANVPVTFTNFKEKRTLNFSLKKVKDAWKIDDIKYSASDSLMKVLKASYPADSKVSKSSDGEFEGSYKVGDTSCTVKPIKMAFEIRWAKGKGVEVFLFKEGTTFESEDEGGSTNSFVFDDESYNTGTFYRGDGKKFAVRRAGSTK